MYTFSLPNNLHDPKWTAEEAYDQPLLSYYVYGAVNRLFTQLHLTQGTSCVPSEEDLYRYSIPQKNITVNTLPPTAPCALQQLRAMRTLAVFLSIATLAIIIAVGNYLGSTLIGILASFMFLINDTFLLCMTRAMGDPILIFFFSFHLLLCLYATKYYVREIFPIWLSITLGITTGLAVATKLNGILLLISLGFITIGTALQKWNTHYKHGLRLTIIALLLPLVVSYDVFFLLNPPIWANPIKLSKTMVEYRLSTLAASDASFTEESLPTIHKRILRVVTHTLLPYGAFSTFKPLPLDLLFFLLGLCTMFYMAIMGNMSIVFFLLWTIPIVSITILFLFVDWNRYYLPIIMIVKIIQSFGIVFVLRTALDKINKYYVWHIRHYRK